MFDCVLMNGNSTLSVKVTGCVNAVLFWVKLEMFLPSERVLKLCDVTTFWRY